MSGRYASTPGVCDACGHYTDPDPEMSMCRCDEPVRCVEVNGDVYHVPAGLRPGDDWDGDQCEGCASAAYLVTAAGVVCTVETDNPEPPEPCGMLHRWRQRPAREVIF